MTGKISTNVLGSLLAVSGIVMFSAKAVMVKLGYHYDVDLLSLLFLRMLFAFPIYLILSVIKFQKFDRSTIAPKHWLTVAALGAIGYYLASYFDFNGLQYIPAGIERLILFVYPTIVLLISALLLKEKVTRIQWLAIAVTYAGIVITFLPNLSQGAVADFWKGAGFIFLSAFTFAFYIVESGRMIPKFGPTLFTSVAMMVASICVFIHYGFGSSTVLYEVPWEGVAIGFTMAIFSTVLPSFLLSEAIKRLGSSNFVIFGSLGPISTIVFARIFLNEIITVWQIIGTAVDILGILVVTRKKAQS